MAEKAVELESAEQTAALFGNGDHNIDLIEKAFHVVCLYRGNSVKFTGSEEDVDAAAQAVNGMLNMLGDGMPIEEQMVHYCIGLARRGEADRLQELTEAFVTFNFRGKPIRPKTLGQKEYLAAIRAYPITFCVGPAGTGKTYLAVSMAVRAFKNKEVSRIVLTRPAVEAGERLGFLPGDLQEKIYPYLRPLYDSLFDLLGTDACQHMVEKQQIEVAPLAYMRGRTLDDSFIILDEAQNTTSEQMKMFLTRIGSGSHVVVTGDITQVDLPYNTKSGMQDALHVLEGVEGIAHVYLTEKDVVRHPLVQRIIRAYEKAKVP